MIKKIFFCFLILFFITACSGKVTLISPDKKPKATPIIAVLAKNTPTPVPSILQSVPPTPISKTTQATPVPKLLPSVIIPGGPEIEELKGLHELNQILSIKGKNLGKQIGKVYFENTGNYTPINWSENEVTLKIPDLSSSVRIKLITTDGKESNYVFLQIKGTSTPGNPGGCPNCDPQPPQNNPPTCTITSPGSGTNSLSPVNITVAASDDVAVTRVEIYEGEILLGEAQLIDSSYTYSWTTSMGSHTIKAKAYDAVTSTESAEITFDVTPTCDANGPVLAITSPTESAAVDSPANIEITATDAETSVAKVELYEGANIEPFATLTNTPYNYSWNTDAGVKIITVKAYDTCNNITEGIRNFTVKPPPGGSCGAWWNCDWSYRQVVEINNGTGEANYPVQVTLRESSVNFWTHVKSDGSDIRFIDSNDSTALSYHIDSFDSINKLAIIWVKIPSVTPAKVIYLYYGNAGAQTVSYLPNVFPVVDDFSTDPNTNGKWTVYKYANAPQEAQWDYVDHHWDLTTSSTEKAMSAFYNYDLAITNWYAGFKYLAADPNGADGFVFMFYKDKTPYIPANGYALGFTKPGPANVDGYGVEFDEYKNGIDTVARHVAVLQNNYCSHLDLVQDSRVGDKNWHKVDVYFINGRVKIYLDYNILIDHTLAVQDYTYTGLGFCSATGAYSNKHTIDDFVFTPNNMSIVVNTNFSEEQHAYNPFFILPFKLAGYFINLFIR